MTMAQRDVKLLVAAHKQYWMPSDEVYQPIEVGAALRDEHPGYQRDDEGENISAENPRYCELTALYWGWKNLDCEYLGLAHYRRHFKGAGERETLTAQDLDALLDRAPVVLPVKRNYYITTVEAHYGDTFDPKHIEYLRAAIARLHPECLGAFNANMAKKTAHILNMFIMRRDLLDAYCNWMFDILRAVEPQIDFSGMSAFEARVMGRLSERLLDTWVDVNDVDYVECPLVGMEKTNWLKKGGSFLAAKFLGKKYDESF